MRGNMKMKGILIATAFLLVMALAGSASAQEATPSDNTAVSDVAPGDACRGK